MGFDEGSELQRSLTPFILHSLGGGVAAEQWNLYTVKAKDTRRCWLGWGKLEGERLEFIQLPPKGKVGEWLRRTVRAYS